MITTLAMEKKRMRGASNIYMVIGSMVVIDAKCSNDHCCIWQSQSCHGTLPWRDMLCAAATLFTRSNPTQVFIFFKEQGIVLYFTKEIPLFTSSLDGDGEQQSLLTFRLNTQMLAVMKDVTPLVIVQNMASTTQWNLTTIKH